MALLTTATALMDGVYKSGRVPLLEAEILFEHSWTGSSRGCNDQTATYRGWASSFVGLREWTPGQYAAIGRCDMINRLKKCRGGHDSLYESFVLLSQERARARERERERK